MFRATRASRAQAPTDATPLRSPALLRLSRFQSTDVNVWRGMEGRTRSLRDSATGSTLVQGAGNVRLRLSRGSLSLARDGVAAACIRCPVAVILELPLRRVRPRPITNGHLLGLVDRKIDEVVRGRSLDPS